MRFVPFHPGVSGVAGLCTIALFAVAAWFPDDAIDLAAWLVAVLLGLPVTLAARLRAVRDARATDRSVPALLTFARRVLGALSLLLGAGILGWQADRIVERLPLGATAPAAAAQALLCLALAGLGYRLLKRRWDSG